MILDDYIELAAYETAFWMAGVYDDEFPIAELGDLALEVCAKLRSVAAMVLLTRGSVDGFFHNLIRSGRVWERYLQRCARENAIEDYHRCSGRTPPLFDAMASGDHDVVRRIAELSPTYWRVENEYEDDFCYGRGLQCLWIGEEGASLELIVQFKKYVNGQGSARLSLLEAIAAKSRDDFDSAFEELLRERQLEIAANMARGELEEPHVIAARNVFLEGLAILKLAERREIPTAEEYLYCPSIARQPMRSPFPGE